MTTVYASRTISAPADRVWRVVRDFAGLDSWVPDLPGVIEVIGDPEVPGAERVFRFDGAIAIVERLVALDDEALVTSYAITRAPTRMDRHLATIRLSAQGGTTLVEWEATFETDAELVDQISARMISSTFEPGLKGLAERCERP